MSLSALCSKVTGLLLGRDHIALGNLTVNNPRMRPILVQEMMVGGAGGRAFDLTIECEAREQRQACEIDSSLWA